MAKHWKPGVEEDVAEARRQQLLGRNWAARPQLSRWRLGGATIDRHEARFVLILGILLGLAFTFLPPLFQRTPKPDVPMSKREAQRIVTERTRERIGDGTMPEAPELNVSFVEPRPAVAENVQAIGRAEPQPITTPPGAEPIGM